MKTRFFMVMVVLSACGRPPRVIEQPVLVVSGFTSRETSGEESLFDLSASTARMVPVLASEEPIMQIEGVKFVLFRQGQKSAAVSADSGSFDPKTKAVEFHGRVSYTALDDSFHVRSSNMAWDPESSTLICEHDVEGFFRDFQFTAARLDIARSRRVFYLQNATFVGPG